MNRLVERQKRYAQLLIQTGINLQPGQGLHLSAELAHAPFVRVLVAMAYDAGASYVDLHWVDNLVLRARLLHSQPDNLDYFPPFQTSRFQQFLDEGWARLSLVGPEFPDALSDVSPALIRRATDSRRQRVNFYLDASMNNRFQWCVAAVPTAAWASQIFPDLPGNKAVERLWEVIFQVCRIDEPDPVAAWMAHDAALRHIVDYLDTRQIRALHFLDPAPGRDGQPRTQLTVGLTAHPYWVAASSQTPEGVRFFANMPTEEIFSTPHRLQTSGWATTTKPFFPFERRVEDARFHFEAGQLVDYSAKTGQDLLDQFFTAEGARYLGEVALVDDRSPVNQSGILFYETLFDENAVCHIAFGKAYPEGVRGGSELDESEYADVGINQSAVHLDVMIGSPTLSVTGTTAAGEEVPLLQNGRFVQAALS